MNETTLLLVILLGLGFFLLLAFSESSRPKRARNDWRTISYISMIIGGIFPVGGYFDYSHAREVEDYVWIFPYRQGGILLLVLGGILVAIGVIILLRTSEEAKS